MLVKNVVSDSTNFHIGGEVFAALQSVEPILEHQVAAYELRLKLQPGSAGQQREFSRVRNSEKHIAMQRLMGLELIADYTELGQDVVKLLRIFGKHLMEGEVRAPSALGQGFVHGLLVEDGGRLKSTTTIALPPKLVSELASQLHQRWRRVKNQLELPLDSMSQQSIQRIDRRITKELHLMAKPEDAPPLLTNCDRIAVLAETTTLAKLTEGEFSCFLKTVQPGNPSQLPLQMWSSDLRISPTTSTFPKS